MPGAENKLKRSPCVLIVDDDPTTRISLDRLLRNAGMETVLADTLAGAETHLRKQPVSLALLDVHLPDGTGLDLCRKWTKHYAFPILFISADSDIDTKTKGFAAGGVDYITKPLIGAEVMARVKTHLKLKAAHDDVVAMHADKIRSLSRIQNSLMPLPTELPEARFQVALRQTNQAGGDFYDVIPLGHGITDYIAADVSGHDIEASLLTASFKSLLGEFASVLNSPLDTCRMLNNSLRRIMPEGSYFTAIYARLNRNTDNVTLVNAGHPPAVLVDMQAREPRIVEQSGDLLGIFEDADFGVHEQTVRTGDRLYIFTDGLIEQANTRDEGMRRFMEVCRGTLDEPLDDSVFFGLASVCVQEDIDDDIVLMGIEV